MPQTRDNGGVVPINADTYALVTDLTTLNDSLNVATVCTSQAAMDALVKFNGRLAIRTDLGGAMFKTDGTTWAGATLAVPFGHMGRTAGFQSVNSVSPVTVAMAAAQTLKGGVTFDDANDALVVPIGGYYRLTGQGYTSGAGTSLLARFRLRINGVDSGAQLHTWKANALDFVASGGVIVQLSANDKISITVESDPASASFSVWGTTGFNGTYAEVQYVGPAGTY